MLSTLNSVPGKMSELVDEDLPDVGVVSRIDAGHRRVARRLAAIMGAKEELDIAVVDDQLVGHGGRIQAQACRLPVRSRSCEDPLRSTCGMARSVVMGPSKVIVPAMVGGTS